jgi:hypothetical protein
VKGDFSLRRPEQGFSGGGGRKEKTPCFVLNANGLTFARLRFERGKVPKKIAGVRFHNPSLSDIILFVKQCRIRAYPRNPRQKMTAFSGSLAVFKRSVGI